MDIIRRCIFIIAKYVSIFVIVLSAVIIKFKLYFFLGFEETLSLTFIYILPSCIFFQGVVLRLYSEEILRYCIFTLLIYSCVYCFVLGTSCLYYIPEFCILYFIAFVTIGFYRYVRGNNVEEDIEYFEEEDNKDDSLWID